MSGLSRYLQDDGTVRTFEFREKLHRSQITPNVGESKFSISSEFIRVRLIGASRIAKQLKIEDILSSDRTCDKFGPAGEGGGGSGEWRRVREIIKIDSRYYSEYPCCFSNLTVCSGDLAGSDPAPMNRSSGRFSRSFPAGVTDCKGQLKTVFFSRNEQ